MKDEDFQFIFDMDFEQEPEQYDDGYKKILQERQKKKDDIKLRLKKYYFDDKEIDYMIKIIEKCEKKIEKIKNSYDFTVPKDGEATKMLNELLIAQQNMKQEFDNELLKIMKKKYEKAKKILEERKKHQG